MNNEAENKMAQQCPYDLWNEEVVYDGRWMVAKKIEFKLKNQETGGIWESAHRCTNPKHSTDADGVDIIAVLKKSGKKYFVLIKQYRIPVRSWVIEFPAGLVDHSDPNIEATGIRELKEETGYTVTKVLGCSSGKQFLDPGLGDDSIRFLFVEIDGDAEENLHPKQELVDEEHIQVLLVECDQLLDFCDEVNKSDDTEIEAMVYTFAFGYCMNQKFGL